MNFSAAVFGLSGDTKAVEDAGGTETRGLALDDAAGFSAMADGRADSAGGDFSGIGASREQDAVTSKRIAGTSGKRR